MYRRGDGVESIRPGRLIENAFIESFNGKLRDEWLNLHWFIGLRDACFTIEGGRRDYNEVGLRMGSADWPAPSMRVELRDSRPATPACVLQLAEVESTAKRSL